MTNHFWWLFNYLIDAEQMSNKTRKGNRCMKVQWQWPPENCLPENFPLKNCPPENCPTYPENCHLWKLPLIEIPTYESPPYEISVLWTFPPPPLKLHPRKLPLRKLNSRKLSPLKVLPPSWLFQAPINNNKMNLLIKIATIVMGN